VAVWATKVVDSTTVRLPAGTEDLLDLVVGLVVQVVQVGLVLLVGFQVMVPPVVVPVVMEVTEAISSERAQEVTRTETQSGHGTRFVANCTPPGEVPVGGMIAFSPFLSVSCFSVFVCLWGLVSIAWRLRVANC
jgi:hypothetical protein